MTLYILYATQIPNDSYIAPHKNNISLSLLYISSSNKLCGYLL